MIESLENRRVLANFEVTSLSDVSAADSVVTLREAIVLANTAPGADTIMFKSGLVGTIDLTQGQMLISDSLTITGHGATSTVVDAQQDSRIFGDADRDR